MESLTALSVLLLGVLFVASLANTTPLAARLVAVPVELEEDYDDQSTGETWSRSLKDKDNQYIIEKSSKAIKAPQEIHVVHMPAGKAASQNKDQKTSVKQFYPFNRPVYPFRWPGSSPPHTTVGVSSPYGGAYVNYINSGMGNPYGFYAPGYPNYAAAAAVSNQGFAGAYQGMGAGQAPMQAFAGNGLGLMGGYQGYGAALYAPGHPYASNMPQMNMAGGAGVPQGQPGYMAGASYAPGFNNYMSAQPPAQNPLQSGPYNPYFPYPPPHTHWPPYKNYPPWWWYRQYPPYRPRPRPRPRPHERPAMEANPGPDGWYADYYGYRPYGGPGAYAHEIEGAGAGYDGYGAPSEFKKPWYGDYWGWYGYPGGFGGVRGPYGWDKDWQTDKGRPTHYRPHKHDEDDEDYEDEDHYHYHEPIRDKNSNHDHDHHYDHIHDYHDHHDHHDHHDSDEDDQRRKHPYYQYHHYPHDHHYPYEKSGLKTPAASNDHMVERRLGAMAEPIISKNVDDVVVVEEET